MANRITATRADSTTDAEAAQRVQLAISRLARRLRQESSSGLTPSQLSALATVHHAGPLTLGELAEAERVAPPSISRMVARLEADGYLERVRDPDDRRVVRVSATQAGRELVARARARKAAWVHSHLDRLESEERAAILAAADALERLAGLP